MATQTSITHVHTHAIQVSPTVLTLLSTGELTLDQALDSVGLNYLHDAATPPGKRTVHDMDGVVIGDMSVDECWQWLEQHQG